MDHEVDRHLHRWLDADAEGEEGREEEAESAFRVVFASAVSDPPVPAEFTSATMEAVAQAAARDQKAARLTRVAAIWLGLAGGAALTWFSAGLIASAISTGFTAMLDLVIGAIVRVATSGQPGTSLWTVFGNLGRAAAAFATSPTVTITILTVQAIAIAALVALQRILGSDLE
jgi:hypothetical protein